MFLSRRSTQAEYFDDRDKSPAEVAAAYQDLGRVNRLFRFTYPYVLRLPRLLGTAGCRRLDLLDLGAGDGTLGCALSEWAARRGWDWRVTDLDLNPQALQLNANARKVAGSALDLPFDEASFDVVIASQMTHHLGTDAEIAQHFREAWRVTRDVVMICDLHRNPGLYGLVWLGTRLVGCTPEVRADGVVSVARGFRVPEWRALAAQAGIPNARVSLFFGTRILLEARKRAA